MATATPSSLPPFPTRTTPVRRLRLVIPVLLVLVLTLVWQPAQLAVRAAAPATGRVAATGQSNVEQARALLEKEGYRFYLVVVSTESRGVEREIYQDLRLRGYRSTVGPDEGIDTRSEVCYPRCVYVPVQAINQISVSSWLRVLRHEYRHVTQEINNPNMAQDARDADSQFTPYGAFLEACADYGINAATIYHAATRIPQLRNALGPGRRTQIDLACAGDVEAYHSVVEQYNQEMGNGAFARLFPSYW